jgi:hypothetical protein
MGTSIRLGNQEGIPVRISKRFRPGTVAFKEIEELYKKQRELMMTRLPIQRMVKEIMRGWNSGSHQMLC